MSLRGCLRNPRYMILAHPFLHSSLLEQSVPSVPLLSHCPLPHLRVPVPSLSEMIASLLLLVCMLSSCPALALVCVSPQRRGVFSFSVRAHRVPPVLLLVCFAFTTTSFTSFFFSSLLFHVAEQIRSRKGKSQSPRPRSPLSLLLSSPLAAPARCSLGAAPLLLWLPGSLPQRHRHADAREQNAKQWRTGERWSTRSRLRTLGSPWQGPALDLTSCFSRFCASFVVSVKGVRDPPLTPLSPPSNSPPLT